MKNNRRQFLRNISLAPLAVSLAPHLGTAKNSTPKNNMLCEETTLDLYGQGPFYTQNPPSLENNLLATTEEEGARIIISGRVYDLSCAGYIPNTEIDIWHANSAGQYDNDGFNLRGKTTTNEQGFYVFETIMPGKYLNGSQFRPAHIHFRITPPNFPTLITQLYFEGDTDIAADRAASVTEGEFDATHRIIPLQENSEGKLEGTWDISISGDSITGVRDIHLDKGIIYKTVPNPFSDKLFIRYGVFQKAKVDLLVYDMQARLVATLEERSLAPNKYEAEWIADAGLPNGYYFMILKINELQVHYLKVMYKKD